jgi:hypothetical protein
MSAKHFILGEVLHPFWFQIRRSKYVQPEYPQPVNGDLRPRHKI